METKENCRILLDKATQKVKCYRFKSKELKRELALHEDSDDKNKSSVTDIITGCRLFGINKKVKDVKDIDIKENLIKFINHYTIDAINSKFSELDKVPMEERFRKAKK